MVSLLLTGQCCYLDKDTIFRCFKNNLTASAYEQGLFILVFELIQFKGFKPSRK